MIFREKACSSVTPPVTAKAIPPIATAKASGYKSSMITVRPPARICTLLVAHKYIINITICFVCVFIYAIVRSMLTGVYNSYDKQFVLRGFIFMERYAHNYNIPT